jgi:predicted ATPase
LEGARHMLRGEAEQLARLTGASGELIGRARDKGTLLAATRKATRLVTVTGLPGVGKTALALAAAASATAYFPDGVWPVPLGQLRDSELVAHTVAQALGLPDRLNKRLLDGMAAELGAMRMLLVLDTCEHLLAGCAELVTALARTCPYIRIIATSRQPLRVPGEHVQILRPLTLGHAVVLFGRRARQVRPAFRVTPQNRPLITDICRRLDRLPLAIELAARQLDSMSLDELRADLNSGLGMLHNGADAPGRHQTMGAAIGWSHQLCSPAERLLWARLSVFGEPFLLEDAKQVCGGPHLPAGEVGDALAGLAERSVLLTDPSAGTDRAARVAGVEGPSRPAAAHRMPETIRAYGAAMLLRLGEERAVHARYRAWQAHRK